MTNETTITTDELAGMMNKAFIHLEKKVDAMNTSLTTELIEVKDRLDIIEGKLINNHEARISKNEDDIRTFKVKLQH